MAKIRFILMLLVSLNVCAQVEIKQVNLRFAWLRVPSKYVKAGLTKPVDGLSICFIEINTPKFKFDFVTRRAVLYDECMFNVMAARKILKKNKFVEVIGTSPQRDKKHNEYFALWDLVEGDSGCVSFFGGDECKDRPEILNEIKDWKNKAIDPKIYP